MPSSNDGFRAVAVLVSACMLLCGPAWALDAELGGAGDELLGSSAEIATAPDDPVVRRDKFVDGFVEESLEDSLAMAGLPAALGLELKDALSSALDRRPLESGDRFEVRYQQTVAADGREVGASRIVSADVRTAAKGRIALYGFRPTRGAEQLWLGNGESLASSAMRLPLDTASVTSGFGVRADPFEQPRNGLGAPSKLGTVGASLNVATARGIALGLAPAPGRSVARGGAAFLMHNGVDLLAPTGTPVLAASDGTIVGAAPNAGYGNWIRIDHGNNMATVYGHLSAFAPGIAGGVKVRRGQVIGLVGNTGRSTGPHLHFEVISNGQAVDPMKFSPTKKSKLEGADLESFRKLVRQVDAARHEEAPLQLISAGDRR